MPGTSPVPLASVIASFANKPSFTSSKHTDKLATYLQQLLTVSHYYPNNTPAGCPSQELRPRNRHFSPCCPLGATPPPSENTTALKTCHCSCWFKIVGLTDRLTYIIDSVLFRYRFCCSNLYPACRFFIGGIS